jgi:CheY-like chemotaxis protein
MTNQEHVRPQRILIVDDEAVIRDMMVDILDLEGYPVEVARNGQEALEKVLHSQSNAGYLIFLDLMMPVLDGYEFCHALDTEPGLRQKQVVVIMSALDQLAKASSLHADAAMPKPFVMDDVLKVIQQYM